MASEDPKFRLEAEPRPQPMQDEAPREPTPGASSEEGEGGERAAREKLKVASIDGLRPQSKGSGVVATGDHPLASSITSDAIAENGSLRGRPSKKRSFEDLQKDDQTDTTENGSVGLPDPKRSSHHKRMRSRDVQSGDQQDIGKLGEAGSPVHEESDDEAQMTPGGPGILVKPGDQAEPSVQAPKEVEKQILEEEDTIDEPTVGVGDQPVAPPSTAAQQPRSEPVASTESTTHSSILPSSGFANTSTSSPFGSTSPPSSENNESSKPTSRSAFASSGLSAFASSEKSPFGAAGSTTSTGGFGGGGTGFGSGSSSTFGSGSKGLGATPAFASKDTSGFGTARGFGSTPGFGATKPFGSGGSSFGNSAAGPSAFSKGKAFGSKDEEDEEDEEEGDENDAPEEVKEDKQDSRFGEHGKVASGEEDEETIHTCRAKLFHFEGKEWKERGTGVLKINIRFESPAEGDMDENQEVDPEAGSPPRSVQKARLIMRADGVHRVILNSPVFKEQLIGAGDGSEPSGRTMSLMAIEDGEPKKIMLRTGKDEAMKELYHKIMEVKADL